MREEYRSTVDIGGLDGVERGADGAPTAFRIWHAGSNTVDSGEFFFTEASAAAVLQQQAERGNLYSIDVDHLSMNKDSPPEARRAVGWHRLDVRDGELWAVDVKFTPDIAASFMRAMQSGVPEWRYFSPVYTLDPKTAEVTRYITTALTNTPATWNVTALATIAASATVDNEDPKKMARRMKLDAFKKMAEEAAAFKSALESALAAFQKVDEGDEADEADEDKADAPPDSEPAPDAPKDEPKEAKADEAEEADEDKVKANTDALVAKELAAKYEAANVRIQALEAERDAAAAASAAKRREEALNARLDVSPELRAELSKSEHSDAHVASVLAAIPVSSAAALIASQSATRGGDELHGLSYRSEHAKEMDRRFGLMTVKASVKNDGNFQIVGAPEIVRKESK